MDDSQAVLSWDRGVLELECDRSATVREGVEAYLGRKVFASSGDVIVRVTLSSKLEAQGKRRVEATVSQEDAQGRVWGERRVSGDASCDSLDEQLTLVIALMVDAPSPNLAAEPETPPPPPPPPPAGLEAGPAADSEIVTAPSLERGTSSPPHAALLGFGAAALGATPELGLGAGVVALFKPRGFWGLGIDATLFAPRRQALDAGSLEVSLIVAGASLCPFQALEEATWWSICGNFQVARLEARSRGLLDARRDRQFFALPGLSARFGRVLFGRWLLAGGVQLGFPVSPNRYAYRDATGERHVAFEVSSFVVMTSLGVGVILN
jgi:hypothetical protein